MNSAISNHLDCTPKPLRRQGGSIMSRIFGIEALWRSRQILGTLDQSRLDDIGRTPEEAKAEARKGIWDGPAHWTK